MIVLDTNALYLLSGFDSNKEADLEAIRAFLKDKEVCMTCYTLFELLNNKKTTFFLEELLAKIPECCKGVRFGTSMGVDKYIKIGHLLGIQYKGPKLKEEARIKLGQYISNYYSNYYSNLIAACVISYFILFAGAKKNESFDLTNNEYKKSIQEAFNIICTKLKDYLDYQLYLLNKKHDFTEKNIKLLLIPILKKTLLYFVSLINIINSSFENNTFSLYKVSNKLISQSRKYKVDEVVNSFEDYDYKDVMLYEIFLSGVENINKKALERFIRKLTDSFVDDNPYFGECINISFQKNLMKILMTNENLHSNDVTDSLIVDCAIGLFKEQVEEDNVFVTFDNNLIKKINLVKSTKISVFSPRLKSNK